MDQGRELLRGDVVIKKADVEMTLRHYASTFHDVRTYGGVEVGVHPNEIGVEAVRKALVVLPDAEQFTFFSRWEGKVSGWGGALDLPVQSGPINVSGTYYVAGDVLSVATLKGMEGMETAVYNCERNNHWLIRFTYADGSTFCSAFYPAKDHRVYKEAL